MAENVRPNIIDTDFTVDKMINIFSSKGLSVQDLVVLSGTLCFLIFNKESDLSLKKTLKIQFYGLRSTHYWSCALQHIQQQV